MADERLIQWVKKQRLAGYNDRTLRWYLLEHGFKKEDVDEALGYNNKFSKLFGNKFNFIFVVFSLLLPVFFFIYFYNFLTILLIIPALLHGVKYHLGSGKKYSFLILFSSYLLSVYLTFLLTIGFNKILFHIFDSIGYVHMVLLPIPFAFSLLFLSFAYFFISRFILTKITKNFDFRAYFKFRKPKFINIFSTKDFRSSVIKLSTIICLVLLIISISIITILGTNWIVGKVKGASDYVPELNREIQNIGKNFVKKRFIEEKGYIPHKIDNFAYDEDNDEIRFWDLNYDEVESILECDPNFNCGNKTFRKDKKSGEQISTERLDINSEDSEYEGAYFGEKKGVNITLFLFPINSTYYSSLFSSENEELRSSKVVEDIENLHRKAEEIIQGLSPRPKPPKKKLKQINYFYSGDGHEDLKDLNIGFLKIVSLREMYADNAKKIINDYQNLKNGSDEFYDETKTKQKHISRLKENIEEFKASYLEEKSNVDKIDQSRYACTYNCNLVDLFFYNSKINEILKEMDSSIEIFLKKYRPYPYKLYKEFRTEETKLSKVLRLRFVQERMAEGALEGCECDGCEEDKIEKCQLDIINSTGDIGLCDEFHSEKFTDCVKKFKTNNKECSRIDETDLRNKCLNISSTQ